MKPEKLPEQNKLQSPVSGVLCQTHRAVSVLSRALYYPCVRSDAFSNLFQKGFEYVTWTSYRKRIVEIEMRKKKSTKCITLPNHYKCHLGCFFSHVYGICLNNIPAPDKCLLGDWIKWLSKCCNQNHTSWWSNFFSHFNPHKPLFFDIGR